MHRRKFLEALGLGTVSGLFLKDDLFARMVDPGYLFKELRKGSGVYVNKGGTIGWLINKDALVIIDSQFPPTAKVLLEEIHKKTGRKIDILFNTHHHRDHTSGNPFLKKYSNKIVAHKNCVRLQRERNNDGKTALVTADETFERTWQDNVGAIRLKAYHHSNAHTGGDAILNIENYNIVHMGDLVFNDVYPYVDKDDEASLSGWIEFLDNTYNMFDDETLFIFGHSDKPNKVYGKRSELIEMRNYLEALINFAKKEIRSGKGHDEIMKNEFVPGFENRKAMWKGAFQLNLKAALREIQEN